MRILGIESSCDDCAAAVLQDGRKVLSQVVHSQFHIHHAYGGVVPELASRDHLEKIVPVLETAMGQARLDWSQLDGIAVTCGPGLIGSLLVGLSAAKALSFALGIPFYGVNHLEGHLLAVFLEERTPSFPFLGMIISGGHTSLYRVNGFCDYSRLGQTRDDAAGEAFDKVAKLLGLGYPGGVAIDKLGRQGNPGAFPFPRAMAAEKSLDFSFSGLKTAVRTFVVRQGEAFVRENLADLVSSFQEAVVDSLLNKLFAAVSLTGIRGVVLSGGVAANSRLRDRVRELAEKDSVEVFLPSPLLCTDNAVMIAAAGSRYLEAGKSSPLTLNADANLQL